MIIRPGSIGLVKDSIVPRKKRLRHYLGNLHEPLIELGQRGDFHHTYNFLTSTKISEALGNFGTRKVVTNPYMKYWDGKSVSLILIPRKDIFSDEDLKLVIAQWEREVGMPYDYLGCLGFSSDKRRKCSEHTASGYAKLGYKFWSKPIADVVPNDIATHALYTKFKDFEPFEIPDKEGV